MDQDASNTDGTINTTATSANTTAGFSISTFTGNGTPGATIGHGLSQAPELVIIKGRNTTNEWPTKPIGWGDWWCRLDGLYVYEPICGSC